MISVNNPLINENGEWMSIPRRSHRSEADLSAGLARTAPSHEANDSQASQPHGVGISFRDHGDGGIAKLIGRKVDLVDLGSISGTVYIH